MTSMEVARSPRHSPTPTAPAPGQRQTARRNQRRGYGELPVPSGDHLCSSRNRRLADPKGCLVNTDKVYEDRERKASDAALSEKGQIPH